MVFAVILAEVAVIAVCIQLAEAVLVAGGKAVDSSVIGQSLFVLVILSAAGIVSRFAVAGTTPCVQNKLIEMVSVLILRMLLERVPGERKFCKLIIELVYIFNIDEINKAIKI